MMPGRHRGSPSHSDENSMASHDGPPSPTYVLEHLATFTVSPENDLVYPADGMRRLLAMEKTNGIWTQKMLMKIDRGMIHIMDHENKEIVEKFPLGLVREPTAFTSSDPKEMYNNILIYVVGHPPAETPIPAEMHIFQCVNVRAREVVEDLKSCIAGGKRHHTQGRGGGGGGRSSDFGEIKMGDLASPYEDAEAERAVGQRMMQAQLEADETSSTSSDRYERDVTILNRCFDDIEKFIARLQHAAAAFRELEKRRRSRKSKKKDLGDGMLSVRAKPPPEREFIDIFQKFKLSFNLLAKLKAHIHDPNAPELVHFLFTPLALIVDASHDSHYGPNLPSKVVAPLMTSEAVELLVNCLTSKESELWHSLGEPWYVSRQEWKGYVPPYRPVFMDGWSPPVIYDDEEGGGDLREEVDEVDGVAGGREMYRSESETEVTPLPPPSAGGQRSAGSTRILKEEYRGGNNGGGGVPHSDDDDSAFLDNWAADLMRRGIRVVQVTYPRTANNDKELTVDRGEFLELIDDSRKWWKVRNSRQKVGHVPHTIVSHYDPSQRAPHGPPPPMAGHYLPPPPPPNQPGEWIQRERRGKKGEFRYF